MRRWTLVALLVLAACDSDGQAPPRGPASVTIVNQSQYELRELRVHEAASYNDAKNMLDSMMGVGESVVLHRSGEFFVTVFREKNRGGEVLAFTTGRPLNCADGTGYKLNVFDEAFRLENATWVKSSTTTQ